jgi:hypothetical protein
MNDAALAAATQIYAANERLSPSGARAASGARQVVEAYLNALSAAEREAGPAPAQFLFGFDDPFGDGGLYVWIVAEDFFAEEGYVDDSSSASSIISRKKRKELEDQTTEDGQDLIESLVEQAHRWLDKATDGILHGEGMESCWDTGYVTERDRKIEADLIERGSMRPREDPYEGKTREQVIEQIKAALIERGFKHEPKLDNNEEW